MGGVDLANQFQAAYETHRTTFQSWWPIFFWLIDAAIVNAYRIQCIKLEELHTPKKDIPSQLKFRESLYQQLFKFSSSSTPIYKEQKLPLTHFNNDLQHVWEQRPTRTSCAWCCFKLGIERKSSVQRRVMQELDKKDKKDKRAPRSTSGCKVCDVPLCKNLRAGLNSMHSNQSTSK